MNILTKANSLVAGDRNDAYGHPADDFARTAAIWSDILGVPVAAAQVGLCMFGVKLSREDYRRQTSLSTCRSSATLGRRRVAMLQVLP